MTTLPTRFMMNPFLAMKSGFISPVENTMEFGAVATGNINAQEVLNTAGNIKMMGSIWLLVATDANKGISKLALAVLLVVSVRKVTKRQMLNTMAQRGRLVKKASCSPSNVLNPE